MTPVGPGTWEAARGGADAALTAAELVLGRRARRLRVLPPARPPRDPRRLRRLLLPQQRRDRRRARCASALGEPGRASLDVDAHHGNGAQSIFYADAGVLTGSVHVDPAPGWFPHFLGFAGEDGEGAGAGANRNLPLAPGSGDEPWVAAVQELAGWAAAARRALVVALGVDAAAGDPESPLEVTADGFRAAGRALGALGLPTVVVQEGGYDLGDDRRARRSPRWTGIANGGDVMTHAGWARTRSRASRSRTRKDVEPPPHWRLEAVAATERPRSLVVGRRPHGAPSSSRTATPPTSGCSTSRAGATPERADAAAATRCPTGRTPTRGSPPTARRSPTPTDGHVWLVAAAGGPPRRLLEAGAPVWLDDATLVVSSSASARVRLAVVDVADPWPRRLATAHGELETHGDEWDAAVSPDRTEVAYVFRPRADLNRSEIRVAALADGAVRARDRHAADAGPRARLVAGRRDARLRLGALGLVGAPPVGRRRRGRAAAHGRRGRLRRAGLAPGRRPDRGHPRRAQPRSASPSSTRRAAR